jgi:diguanylate cyclase (GGDEF)-like protein
MLGSSPIFVVGVVILLGLMVCGLTFFLIRKRYEKRLAGLKRRVEELENQLAKDDTTGLYSARLLTTFIRKSAQATQLTGQPFSIILLDIDDFGRINEYSYDDGDTILRKVAAIVSGFNGTPDSPEHLVFRYKHGDEFLIIARDTDGQKAQAEADSLRESIRHRKFVLRGGSDWVSLSISAGTTQWLVNGDSPASILARAEWALRQAKLKRNAVAAGERNLLEAV